MPQPKNRADRKAALSALPQASRSSQSHKSRPAAPPTPLPVNATWSGERIAQEACGHVAYTVVAPRTLYAAMAKYPYGPTSTEYAPPSAVSGGNAEQMLRVPFDLEAITKWLMDRGYYVCQTRHPRPGDANAVREVTKQLSPLAIAWLLWNEQRQDEERAMRSLETETELMYGPGSKTTTKADDPWFIRRQQRLAKNDRNGGRRVRNSGRAASHEHNEHQARAQMGDFLDDQEASMPQ